MLNVCLGAVFLICYAYQLFYIAVVLAKKERRLGETVTPHKFAVIISARNEQAVIGGLIESIKKQTYPSDLVKIFVVADNCSDKTAEVSRAAGAIVYERFDLSLIGKGYALDFLLDRLNRDYPRDAFDALFIFDADNILSPNYIEEMNKTYSSGYKILTSYRNSKNYGDNWISAGYGLWFLREAKYLNNARMILGTSCAVSGTGFMVDRSVLEDENGDMKWGFHLLTEDIEFSNSSVIDGLCIGYCGGAEFFDEQPTKFSQSWHQRMRWAKGYLQVFAGYGKDLFRGIFGNNKRGDEKRRKWSRFSCFDMSLTIMPALILSGMLFIFDFVAALTLLCIGDYSGALKLILMPTVEASVIVFIVGIITTITEWKKIHTSVPKKILYAFTFPVFMMTYIPIALVSLFKKRVEWKHIEHTKECKYNDLVACKEKQRRKNPGTGDLT